jgi:2-hydroxychromene-2-carboxylate isomerase
VKPDRQIDFYLDFTSPYAYLGSTQIDALAARHDYNVVWRPFLIGATFKTTGRAPLIQHPMVWEYAQKDVMRTARLQGQPFNLPLKFPILTVKPGRLFYYLQDRDDNQLAAKQFAAAVFQAYFVDQKDVTDSRVLGEISVPFGLEPDEVDEIVKSTEMRLRFKAEVNAAIERNVFGAPTFLVNDEMFWGVDHLVQLERWLETGGW